MVAVCRIVNEFEMMFSVNEGKEHETDCWISNNNVISVRITFTSNLSQPPQPEEEEGAINLGLLGGALFLKPHLLHYYLPNIFNWEQFLVVVQGESEFCIAI